MGPPARWAFGDAVCHEADLRGGLGTSRVPEADVLLGLRGFIGRWRQVLATAGAPTLLIQAPGARDWWLGVPDDPGAVVVTVDAYDVFRALAGRRSQDQVSAWEWSSDPTPFLRAGLAYPFRWADRDLVD